MRSLQTTRPVILTIILLVWIGLPVVAWPPGPLTTQTGDGVRGAAQSADEELSLQPGKPIERELSGGQSHFYKITMSDGQYLRITVSQQGIDALVALFTPDGKKVGEADSEKTTVRSETISVIAGVTGAYRIEVRSAETTAKTGSYEIKIEELRDATAEDKYRVAAESLFRQAGQLKEGMLEAKRKGIEKYQEALELYRRAGDRSGEAETLSNIGEVYYSLGESQKALEKYNEALPLRRAVGDRNGEAITLLGLARVEQKRGDLTQARQTVEQAISLIESIRTNSDSQELRASYFAKRQEFFETYIDVLMQMHKQNPAAAFDTVALAVSERARARSLLELLKEARADIRQGVDGSLLERERSLQQRLNARAASQVSLLNRKHTPEQADAAAKEIAAIIAEYEEVQGQIRSRSPRYAALTQPQPLGLAEIQQQALDEDTLLLEYALGEKRSYLWLVSQRSIDSYELPPRAELEAAARRVYELLTARPNRWTPPDQQFIAQARALSRMLLGPVAPRLGGKRLVVVAPGALSYLPFAALPAPEDEKRPAGDYEPLLAKHEVVSIPSASVLSIIRRETAGRQRAAKSVAVLADPVFEASDPRLASAKNGTSSGETTAEAEFSELKRAIRTMNFSDARAGFTRLAFSRQEAESIITLTPKGTGLKATDFNASRDMAMSPQMSQYRIMHFATHGLLNSERPELSGLVFSLIDRKGKSQDGFLRLHEIYNLQLNADLVVLSACETGLGKEIKGEGLIGLTRGFMYSGAPRVVASLWNVDDLATAELMKLFYQRMLKDGLPAGAALRSAQLEMFIQKRWASPYFWAGFVLHGEWK
jgi:CHAT domain-containing protein